MKTLSAEYRFNANRQIFQVVSPAAVILLILYTTFSIFFTGEINILFVALGFMGARYAYMRATVYSALAYEQEFSVNDKRYIVLICKEDILLSRVTAVLKKNYILCENVENFRCMLRGRKSLSDLEKNINIVFSERVLFFEDIGADDDDFIEISPF